ncbi:MAG TPA: aldo/keto reductase [Thermoplasmata archaeon]|nr:aldo/keto reductase [Thermoplasmata archaeon]
MALRVSSSLPLRHGNAIPVLGLGVWQASGKECANAVRTALDLGIRLIDTASMYGNEKEVGEAIRASKVPRDEVFVTTKVWNDEQGYGGTLGACEASLRRLRMEYVDLYLVHWPVPGKRLETWRAMGRLLKGGKVRSVGVSNYMAHHLAELEDSLVKPAVNQIELHPFLHPVDVTEYCRAHEIVVEAYSPLARGRKLRDATVARIAAKHEKSAAQVLIRWGLQHGFVEIPKSIRPERIRENADVFDFALTAAEMKELDALNQGLHVTWDPTDAP